MIWFYEFSSVMGYPTIKVPGLVLKRGSSGNVCMWERTGRRHYGRGKGWRSTMETDNISMIACESRVARFATNLAHEFRRGIISTT